MYINEHAISFAAFSLAKILAAELLRKGISIVASSSRPSPLKSRTKDGSMRREIRTRRLC